MNEYVVSIPVRAESAAEAARALIDALGADEHSINDIGGVRVSPVPEGEKQMLVCQNCGEAFDDIQAAHDHGVFLGGMDPSWCGEDGFAIMPESEDM